MASVKQVREMVSYEVNEGRSSIVASAYSRATKIQGGARYDVLEMSSQTTELT
jgi:hypothetical protein